MTKLQYSPQPVASLATFVALGQGTFSNPPRTPDYSASATLVSPANAKVYGVLPHMHTLGKSIRVENVTQQPVLHQHPALGLPLAAALLLHASRSRFARRTR